MAINPTTGKIYIKGDLNYTTYKYDLLIIDSKSFNKKVIEMP